jgi:hypothetical protein
MGSVSQIRLITGTLIQVEKSLEEIEDELGDVGPRVRFMKIEDTEGRVHLINVNEVVEVEGAD